MKIEHLNTKNIGSGKELDIWWNICWLKNQCFDSGKELFGGIIVLLELLLTQRAMSPLLSERKSTSWSFYDGPLRIQMIKKCELWNSISCSLKDVVGDLLNVVEGQVQPGDLLGRLHKVKGKLGWEVFACFSSVLL